MPQKSKTPNGGGEQEQAGGGVREQTAWRSRGWEKQAVGEVWDRGGRWQGDKCRHGSQRVGSRGQAQAWGDKGQGSRGLGTWPFIPSSPAAGFLPQ